MTLRRLQVSTGAALAVATIACNPFGSAGGSGDDDDTTFDEIPAYVQACLEAQTAGSFEITDESLDAAAEAWDAGADFVVLGGAEAGFDGTCVWMRRTVASGTTKVELGSIRRFEPVVSGTSVRYEVEEAIYYVEETEGATTRWTGDDDADGRPEQRGMRTVDADGATLTSSNEWVDPSTGAVLVRATYTVSGTVARLVREAIDPSTGDLVTVDDVETTRVQGRCASTDDPRPPGDVRDCPEATVGACSPSYERYARSKLRAAAKKGDRCLRGRGVLPKGQLLATAVKRVKIRCFRSPCIAGQLQPGSPPEMHMNTDRIPENATLDAAQQATLFHELLHTFEPFSHGSDTFLELARRLGRVPLVDRTYACESYCFNEMPSACDCAACLETDARGNPVTPCSPVCTQGTEPCCEEQQAIYYCSQAGLMCDTATECASGCMAAGRTFPCKRSGQPCDECCN